MKNLRYKIGTILACFITPFLLNLTVKNTFEVKFTNHVRWQKMYDYDQAKAAEIYFENPDLSKWALGITDLGLILQPWWILAISFDDGRHLDNPFRVWMGTNGFYFLGSAISGVLYWNLLSISVRIRRLEVFRGKKSALDGQKEISDGNQRA